MMKDVTPLEAVTAMGLPVKRTTNGGQELILDCPFCGKREHFAVHAAKGVAYCLRCGWKGNTASLYAELNGLPFRTKQERSKAYSALKQSVSGLEALLPQLTAPAPAKEAETMADTATLDKAYRILIDRLTLAPEDREGLLRRGLSEAAIEEYGYRSVPKKGDDLTQYAKALMREGITPEGIPGFYRRQGKDELYGEWSMVYSRPGILIPVRDPYGNIGGFQIRITNPEGGGKYRWLSSSGRDGGIGAKGRVHFSCPRVSVAGRLIPEFPRWKSGKVAALLTEGPLKADVIRHMSGASVIAVPGVNATWELGESLKFLKQAGVEEICDAFDMDYVTNDMVREASEKIKSTVKAAGMSYIRAQWNKDYKGLDDYLLARKIGQGNQNITPAGGGRKETV